MMTYQFYKKNRNEWKLMNPFHDNILEGIRNINYSQITINLVLLALYTLPLSTKLSVKIIYSSNLLAAIVPITTCTDKS